MTRALGRRRAGGARFVVRLSEAARVVVTLERRTPARRCAARDPRVVRPRRPAPARIVIRRVAGRRSPAGRYRARVRAIDGAGLLSPKRTLGFRLR